MPITSLTPTGRLMLYLLKANPHPWSILDLAAAADSTPITALKTLQWLVRNGYAERTKQGRRSYYTIAQVRSPKADGGVQ